MRDSELFDKAVEIFFKPLARKFALPLSKVRVGVYDISSPHFILRIRLHTGHDRGLNVMLRPASFRDFDEDEPGIQLGIGSFILFQGADLDQISLEVGTDQDFLKQAQLLAQASEHFGLPYLLGQKDDFESVKEMMRKRGEADIERIKKYEFPSFVQRRWHLPKNKPDENS